MDFINRVKSSFFLFFLLFSINGQSQEQVLDKILLNIDNNIYTKSQIERVRKNFNNYKAFSPRIHNFEPTTENIIDSIIQQNLIKKHLNAIGYIISDDDINSQIKSTERSRNISRDFLIQYLERNNITFSEYFNIIGRTIEYDIFYTRTITPLISISEQQIKNAFYEMYKDKSSLAFIIPQESLQKEDLNEVPNQIKTYLKNKIITPLLSQANISQLGTITEEGLSAPIIKELHSTEEGDVSKPVVINGQLHFFYLKKKDLVESSDFISKKEIIKESLIDKEAGKVMASWFKKEAEKHHVKKF